MKSVSYKLSIGGENVKKQQNFANFANHEMDFQKNVKRPEKLIWA